MTVEEEGYLMDLVYFATEGNIEEIEKIIDSGVKPNIGYNHTLYIAVEEKHVDLVVFLLNYEEINPHEEGLSAVFMACQNKDKQILNILLNDHRCNYIEILKDVPKRFKNILTECIYDIRNNTIDDLL